MWPLVWIEALALALPIMASWRSGARARKRLRQGMASEVAVYRLNRFIRYMHAVYVFPFIGVSFAVWYGGVPTDIPMWLHTALCLLGVVLNYTVLRLIYVWYAYPARAEVLQLTQTRLSMVWRTCLSAGGMSLGYGLFYYPLLLPNPAWVNSHQWLLMVYVLLIISVVTVVGTKLTPRFLRSKPIDADSIPDSWRRLLGQSGLMDVRFFLWPTRRRKIANAMAVGIGQPTVVVSDYLQDILSPHEVDAVIAHELGHVRYRHVWLMFALNLAWMPLVMLFSFMMQRIGIANGLITLASLVLYAVYRLVTFAISRWFEYQADAYAAQLHCGSETMTTALESIHTESKSLRTIPWFDELWMTHPSVDHRVQRLAQRSRSSVRGQVAME